MADNIERGNRSFLAITILTSLLFLQSAAGAFAADAVESLQNSDPFASITGASPETPDNIPAVPVPPASPAASADDAQFSSGTLRAYFIDVGQGDSEYIELPNGKNVLIDGGPAPASGDPLVAQFLRQHNVTKIDYVLLTHPHSDHYAGLDYVFSHFPVGSFYDTQADNNGSTGIKNLRAKISGMGVSTFYPAEGDTLNWASGEVQVKVFNSCSAPSASGSGGALNNCSIVLRVSYQNTSILYTGDMQSGVEAQLAQKYGSQLQADVLKVGHHGSSDSSSAVFLNAVKPKAAYIEAGLNNSYGHPTQAALSRLQAEGAAIYRTDQSGTQEYIISGAYTGPLSAAPADIAYSWSQY
ncbi:MAG TPA: hypothetical protein DCL44_01520 [Elusimicrobia bacterium]|nr:hypothetical protein [Elusimicrobiota bacterium]